jgi:uncharacterized protein YqeY
MSLMEDIKVRQLTARKAAAPEASLYTTLLGEAGAIGKNAGNRETTDQEVVAVVKKFIKNLDETINALTSRNQDAGSFLNERSVLEQFLPKQMGEEDLVNIAQALPNLPAFMKHLKENYAGQYDGKLASTVAKSIYQ